MCSLLSQLKTLVNQIDDKGCCSPPCPSGPCCPPPLGCPPCPYPYPQVCMLTPPPCIVPTEPKYVKPLQLPCPPQPEVRDPEDDIRLRIANFYNNYNIDYHNSGKKKSCGPRPECKNKNGMTVDGKSPCCEDYSQKRRNDCEDEGCPTGFKPCAMKLCPPPCCDPLGCWQATIQPCPPKCKKVSNKYIPGPCTRPCCLHWKPKGGPCLYDDPCKAHCYDHPIGIKPRRKV